MDTNTSETSFLEEEAICLIKMALTYKTVQYYNPGDHNIKVFIMFRGGGGEGGRRRRRAFTTKNGIISSHKIRGKSVTLY
jgi:hypothetical protein